MKNRGFSLMELMIVVAIIMILGAGGMWTLKDRLYKNEIIKIKAAVPTLLNSGALRVYERGTSGAALTVTGGSISISNVGAGMEVKSNVFTFVTSPTSISEININNTKKLYDTIVEIMFIVKPDVEEEARNTLIEKNYKKNRRCHRQYRIDVKL